MIFVLEITQLTVNANWKVPLIFWDCKQDSLKHLYFYFHIILASKQKRGQFRKTIIDDPYDE